MSREESGRLIGLIARCFPAGDAVAQGRVDSGNTGTESKDVAGDEGETNPDVTGRSALLSTGRASVTVDDTRITSKKSLILSCHTVFQMRRVTKRRT